jgi:hypothetical protein
MCRFPDVIMEVLVIMYYIMSYMPFSFLHQFTDDLVSNQAIRGLVTKLCRLRHSRTSFRFFWSLRGLENFEPCIESQKAPAVLFSIPFSEPLARNPAKFPLSMKWWVLNLPSNKSFVSMASFVVSLALSVRLLFPPLCWSLLYKLSSQCGVSTARCSVLNSIVQESVSTVLAHAILWKDP